MKGKYFLVIVVFLTIITSLRAQETDPDWLLLNDNDSLVFVPLTSINTSANECNPVKMDSILYFTSDRDNVSGDEPALALNENMHESKQKDGVWSDPTKTYSKNTDDYSGICGSGLNMIYIYKTFGAGDIYYSSYGPTGWSVLKRMKSPINSPFHEQSFALTDRILIVASDRKNKNGKHDLYWGKLSFDGNIKNFQDFSFNTEADEKDVTLSPDGRTMYYSSDISGNYDIYASVLSNGVWQKPIRLPWPINSPSANDGGFYDYGNGFLMNSDRENGNDDIFEGYTYPEKTPIIKILLTAMMSDTTMQKDTTIVITKKTVQQFLSPPSNTYSTASKDTSLIVQLNHFSQNNQPAVSKEDTLGKSEELYARVQVGAYFNSIENLIKFRPTLSSISDSIIIEEGIDKNGEIYTRFLVDQKFKKPDEAITVQREMITRYKIKDAFIAVYTAKDDQRVAIYNSVKGEFVILKDGTTKPVKF